MNVKSIPVSRISILILTNEENTVPSKFSDGNVVCRTISYDIGFLSKFIAASHIYIFGPNGSLHFTILLKEEKKRER